LAEAIESHRSSYGVSVSGESSWDDPLRKARDVTQSIVRHDGVNIGMEQQVLEISKNQMLHNLAITVMGSQFRLLQTIISEHL
jgi:flagellar basal-body rod protein FlgB